MSPPRNSAAREASLLEIIAALPRGHRARGELGALLEVARHDAGRMWIERLREGAQRIANGILDEQAAHLRGLDDEAPR